MISVGYCSPFVPPEWISAHGAEPHWLTLGNIEGRLPVVTGGAICPFAGALIDHLETGVSCTAVVLTTTCDQMRYAAAVTQSRESLPVFLLNVPSTWQTVTSRQLYLGELDRLSRFLVSLGGTLPQQDELELQMENYDGARRRLREHREYLTASDYARATAGLRGVVTPRYSVRSGGEIPNGIPVGLLGGPLLEKHYALFDLVEQAGGRVVLDGTEAGERTLPAPFDPGRRRQGLQGELARAYFESIPDIFRRPNDQLYDWLGDKIAQRGVRGLLFHRYVWCDLWHAELARLKAWSPVPVLEIDACDDDESWSRTSGRIEALLEMLQ